MLSCRFARQHWYCCIFGGRGGGGEGDPLDGMEEREGVKKEKGVGRYEGRVEVVPWVDLLWAMKAVVSSKS